jgi:hypothetical protein
VSCHLSPPPLAVTTAAAALRDSLPGFTVTITPRPDGWAFEVTRIHGDAGPWCLISRDPREIYEALGGGTRKR